MSDLVQTPKSGWSRPENYVQWIVLAALAGLGVHFFDLVLPILNRVMENMILAVFLGLSLTAIGAVLVSKDIHLLLWSYYRSGIRFFTNLLIRIDPVSVLRDGIRRVKKNLKNMSSSDAELASQQRALEELIEANSREYGENMKMMSAAKRLVAGGNESMKGKMILSGRQAGRLQESNMTYQGLLNKIKGYRALTARVREGAEVVVEDMDQTVKNEIIKRKMVRSAYKSLMNAKKVMQGDEQREMYDMALENLANDYFSKIGEMEQFMDESKSFLDGMDLKNGIYAEDALASLDEWEKKTGGILSVGKTKIRVDDGSGELIGRDDELDAPKPEIQKRQSYANLFDIKK
jgi:hypothetical protein